VSAAIGLTQAAALLIGLGENACHRLFLDRAQHLAVLAVGGLASGPKGNLIDGSSLTGLIEDYLQSELSFAQSRAAVRAVVEYLRQRNFILCFAGSDSYAFVHRTFLEHTRAARPAGPRESKP
jgi:hypothetical protein